MDFTLHAPYTFEGLEAWKPALPLQGAAFREKLRSRAFRDAIRAEVSQPAHFRLFNGEWRRVGPGSVVFEASNQLHGLRNAGQTQAAYHVFKWHTPATPKAKGE